MGSDNSEGEGLARFSVLVRALLTCLMAAWAYEGTHFIGDGVD